MENITQSSSSSDTDIVAQDETPESNIIDLGEPPLLQGENRQSYDDLYEHFRSTIAPVDAIEEIFTCDAADATWGILRLRRFKSKLMDARASEGIKRLLAKLVDGEKLDHLVDGWIQGKESAVKRVDKLLAKAGFDHETVLAETLAANFQEIENLDQSLMQKEAHRNAVYREIERHRDALARRLREIATEIEASEIEDVTSPGARLAATQAGDQNYPGRQ